MNPNLLLIPIPGMLILNLGMKDETIRYGIDSLIARDRTGYRNQRAALLSNYAAADSELNPTIRLLADCRDLDLKFLLAPEHGVQGKYQAGEDVPPSVEPMTGLPVISLYDQSVSMKSKLPQDIDHRMREFDTRREGKEISPRILEKTDLIILDIQDIGTRIYTYISTMGYLMESLAGTGKELLVLDRPNPVTGTKFEGPVLEYPEYASFVGYYSIPVRHGLTMGELASLYNRELFSGKVNLSIEKVVNWKREMWFDHTGNKWIPPSPNMPSLNTATVYPGMVFLEGTNLSEGRGTTTPFELFGAPWLKGESLSEELNRLNLPGIRFHPAVFTPEFSKYSGRECSGCRLLVREREAFAPFETMLHILSTIDRLHPGELEIYDRYFNKISGNSSVSSMLIMGEPPDRIIRSYEKALSAYSEDIGRHLLYD